MPRLAPSLALLALAALGLAAVGPVLDHHFAERQPGHAHLYLGDEIPNHLHPYQQSHAHQGAPGAPADTIYLTDYQGLGVDMSTLATPLLDAAPVLPRQGDGPLLAAQDASSPLSETAVPPLQRPPLA